MHSRKGIGVRSASSNGVCRRGSSIPMSRRELSPADPAVEWAGMCFVEPATKPMGGVSEK